MNLPASVIFFVLCILCVHGYPSVDLGGTENTGRVYFPDQAEYIALAKKCPGNKIYWPGDHQCYEEGEQGPCNIGRVLVFNKILLEPKCKDLLIKFPDP